MEIETELRVASDRLLRTLDQLEALENEKRQLKPENDRFQRLAVEIERLAADAFAQTHRQQQIGERAKAVNERSDEHVPAINESTQMRPLQMILNEWRDAERRLMRAAPDSAEHAAAAGDVGRLREEYHAAYTSGSHDQASG